MEKRKRLQNRIEFAAGGAGLMIFPDKSVEGEYKVFTGIFKLSDPESALQDPFNLKQDHSIKLNMQPARYWEARTAAITRIAQSHTFVLVAETCNGEIVDSCRIYFPNNAQRYPLHIYTESKPKYGQDAYMITIEWPEDCDPEDIGNQYIYLTDENNIRYTFLADVIRAQEGRRQIAQFVYEIPEGRSAGEFHVEADSLLREKYDVEIS